MSDNASQPLFNPCSPPYPVPDRGRSGRYRDRLVASVEALIDQVHPNRIKQRQIENVKRFANTELRMPSPRSSPPVAIYGRSNRSCGWPSRVSLASC